MKKLAISAAALLAVAPYAAADIVVNLPESVPGSTVIVESTSVEKMANARSRADLGLVSDTVAIVKGKPLTVKVPADADTRFKLTFSPENTLDLYTTPGEQITLDITAFSPVRYTVKGSPLMEGIWQIDEAVRPIEQAASEIRDGKRPQSEMQGLFEQYTKVLTDFIEKNPSSPAAVYAMLSLQPEDFVKYDSIVAPNAARSALNPMLVKTRERVNAQIEADRKRAEMEQNHVQAPAFTLENLEGKPVSLSDFKGKWLILDFWGSWCGWCIKGFPQLKEAYARYKPGLEVIGIDCQEPKDRWKAGVEKHQLPWVHVYLPQEQAQELLSAYGVQGFPTKVIVNPEGKIMNITSGEDPEFYNILAKLMGK